MVTERRSPKQPPNAIPWGPANLRAKCNSQVPFARDIGSTFSSGKSILLYRRRIGPLEFVPATLHPDNGSTESNGNTTELSALKVVEAVLMISKDPLSARRLAALAELDDPTQARSVARQLNENYDDQGHAFRIEEVAGGMQLLTRPQFAHWLRRLEHIPGEELLSQGMLETLAIVAYRQPILRAEIEAIRGVSCDEVLRQLMQRDLVRINGRKEELGRPFLYGTSKRFLQLFGLQSLDSLPRAQKIRQAEQELEGRLHPRNNADSELEFSSELHGDGTDSRSSASIEN